MHCSFDFIMQMGNVFVYYKVINRFRKSSPPVLSLNEDRVLCKPALMHDETIDRIC